MAVSKGKKAPSFSLPDFQGHITSLKDFEGKWVILYFYPKDMTSGCTLESVDFSQELKAFNKLNTEVIGISPDGQQSHLKFIDKYNLKQFLLSDETKKVLEKYGVWQEKSMYGRKYMGVVRTTVLIDPKGVIRKVWEKVKVPGHVKEVLATIKELSV